MAEHENLTVGELTLTGPVDRPAAINIIVRDWRGDALHVVSTTAASNGASGYAKGCLWVDSDATTGTVLAVNTGTRTSAVWTAIATAGD